MQDFDPENTPEWIQELREKVLSIYTELIETSKQRNKQHKESVDALNKAVNATQQLTLEFLEQIQIKFPK